MISVVICTYNRSAMLERTLASFFQQTGLDAVEHEVLVVDNNSTDDTREVIEQFAARPTLRHLFEPRQGLSCARNRGVAEARGEIVAFLDDDVVVGPTWLVCLRRCFDETNADAVGGRSYLILDEQPPAWLGLVFRLFLSEVELGDERKYLPDGRRLFGLNLGFRKAVLDAHGPFDERLGRTGSRLLSAEETQVLKHVEDSGGIIVYEPDAVVGHLISPDRVTWPYFRKLALGQGTSAARSEPLRKWSGRLRRVLSSFREVRRRAVRVLTERSLDPYVRRLGLYQLRLAWAMFAEHCRRLFAAR
jgi:glycosyltransferase involved in cell wall biosynthesis